MRWSGRIRYSITRAVALATEMLCQKSSRPHRIEPVDPPVRFDAGAGVGCGLRRGRLLPTLPQHVTFFNWARFRLGKFRKCASHGTVVLKTN